MEDLTKAQALELKALIGALGGRPAGIGPDARVQRVLVQKGLARFLDRDERVIDRQADYHRAVRCENTDAGIDAFLALLRAGRLPGQHGRAPAPPPATPASTPPQTPVIPVGDALERASAAVPGEIDATCDALEGGALEEVGHFSREHGIRSLGVLTVTDLDEARRWAQQIAPWIAGQVVVEIGAGVGLLACAMAGIASHVFAIEADPAWSWVFTEHLYRAKPRNLTWIFGRAEDLVGRIRGDVAVVFTRSDVEGMRTLAAGFAPLVLAPLTRPLPAPAPR
jgi:hypothetical protein